MKVHPEVREQFHDLLRFHFAHYRKGKEAGQVREDMRKAALAEQGALLKATCDIEIIVKHEKDCSSLRPWAFYCDCTPAKSIKFVDPKVKQLTESVLRYYTTYPPSEFGL